jgi:hypothetical protein
LSLSVVVSPSSIASTLTASGFSTRAFDRLNLLQDLLVGQQALSHQHPACGILFNHHGPEQFLEGDDLA